jgi:DNA (cytosine-5)-methyltransferase 1
MRGRDARVTGLADSNPSKRPRLLDLFCGAGGAAMGYHRAGFDVVGVDNRPQPHYPFEFIRADALQVLKLGAVQEFVEDDVIDAGSVLSFDAIHASPPCQAYVRSGMVAKDGRHPELIEPVRELLEQTELPWVIENVPGAPIRPDVVLCGSQFGLKVRRHRWFETSSGEPILTLSCDHTRPIAGVYGHPHGKGGPWRNGKRPMLDGDVATWSDAMGIDWMTAPELSQAIPPAYTELIGHQLLAHVKAAAWA